MVQTPVQRSVALKLEIERVALLYRQNVPGVLGLLLYAVSYAWVCGDVMGDGIRVWLAVVGVSAILRLGASWVWLRARDQIENLAQVRRWLRFIQSQLFVSGAAWGVAGWMMRYSHSPEQHIFVSMTVVFMVAGGIVCWSISPPAMLLVVVPAFVPWSLGQALSDNPVSVLMGVLSFLYLLLGSRVGMALHRYVEDSLKLNIENAHLNDVLKSELVVKARAEDSLRLALSSSHAMEWSWDPLRDLFVCQGDLERSLGLDVRYFASTRREFLQLMHVDDRAGFIAALDGVKRGALDFETEIRVLWDDGRLRDLVFRGKGQVTSFEKKISIIGIAWDTTALKIQGRIQQERDVHEAANKAKSMFLANASHEIRTPLAAISGFVESLQQSVEDGSVNRDQMKADLKSIDRNSRHLISLVNDFLDLSKLETGRLDVQKNPMNLRAEIDLSVQMVRSALLAKNISFELQCEPTLPESIESDALRFRQILVNLLSNAIKFTSKGHLKVEVSHRAASDEDGTLVIAVTDSGIGMDDATKRHLFEPFVRGACEEVQKVSGSGLGLTLSRNLARSLNGDLKLLSSTPGRGSRFELSIGTGNTKGLVVAEAVRHTPMRSQLPGLNILVVDDDADLRDLMKRFLERQGAHVSTAINGQLAIEAATLKTFDVVLMDMKMPVVDGYAATAKLRLAGYRAPIIALTAYANSDDKVRSLGAGCDDYLTKPVDFARMLQLVRTYVPHREESRRSLDS